MSDDRFLSRWSDRKLSKPTENEIEPRDKAVIGQPDPDEFEGKSDAEILETLKLPDPEALALGDTVEGFMTSRVPERIRLRALRAFWKTNPVLANIDGLDEYCDDYTDAAMIIENMQTVWQVGKGYANRALDKLEAMAEEAEAIEVTSDVANADLEPADGIEIQSEESEENLVPLEDLDETRSLSEFNEVPSSKSQDSEIRLSVELRPRRMSFT